ncbi:MULTISPECIES: helix-turn-helix transcriptional regulator [Microbacterium]|uniref:Helix-turn-helix protein n=1 Tax=Microbacterium trichothecenolyticum TaxID=69370 RepID=A0A0M2H7S4_MICTR|nr:MULTISPECIES: helix-turn-helix transcriptional regulator [Microbacterium]KJL42575.1 helix-turn-helix protein [Microbacterium trichothecenolyticum]MDR7190328.1 transcriptional regulator with XRE-family HTH domain [Microbacterium sp. BE35]
MSTPDEIRSFLTSRRARITPERAGVPVFGGARRVPGLRREEVAHLAGVSTDYYAKLERGRTRGASREVLDAIARALQLDDIEREHLLNLVDVTAAPHRRKPRPKTPAAATPGTQAVLDAITVPAIVQNARLDVVAANALGAALYPLPPKGAALFNAAAFQFLDRRARDFYIDFARAKRNAVALLHQAAGRDPFDDALIRLIGQLSTQSDEFRSLWASHDVIRYQRGTKRYRHPAVGDLEFGYESFDLTTEPGLTMLVYTVEPHSPTAERMAVLASWAKTPLDSPPHRAETS